jgi:hypothetical protein
VAAAAGDGVAAWAGGGAARTASQATSKRRGISVTRARAWGLRRAGVEGGAARTSPTDRSAVEMLERSTASQGNKQIILPSGWLRSRGFCGRVVGFL